MKLKLLGTVCLSMLLSGCAALNLSKTPKEPKWLLDPYVDGDKIAAVACSGKHFNGVEAQKKLAISRAIDQIATQNSVTVNNVTLRKKQQSSFGGRSSGMNATSLQSVDNVKVSTKTKALYTKKNGDICAWVVQR